jgi:hypothetical protein
LVYLDDRSRVEVAAAFWGALALGVGHYSATTCWRWRRERLAQAAAAKRETDARATMRELARLAREDAVLEQHRPRGVEARPRATGALRPLGTRAASPSCDGGRDVQTPGATLTPLYYRKLARRDRSRSSRGAAAAAAREQERRCPVCQEDFGGTDSVFELCCSHVFHAVCLDKWLAESYSTCPVCRAAIRGAAPPSKAKRNSSSAPAFSGQTTRTPVALQKTAEEDRGSNL